DEKRKVGHFIIPLDKHSTPDRSERLEGTLGIFWRFPTREIGGSFSNRLIIVVRRKDRRFAASASMTPCAALASRASLTLGAAEIWFRRKQKTVSIVFRAELSAGSQRGGASFAKTRSPPEGLTASEEMLKYTGLSSRHAITSDSPSAMRNSMI